MNILKLTAFFGALFILHACEGGGDPNPTLTSSTDLILNKESAVAYYQFSGDLIDALGSYDGVGNFNSYDEDRYGKANESSRYGFSSNGVLFGYANSNFGDLPLSGGNYTFSLWIKVNSSQIAEGINYRLLSKRLTCNEGDFIDMQFSTSAEYPNRIGFELRNDSQSLGNSTGMGVNNLPVDEWVHLTITIDSDNRRGRIYINGEMSVEKNSWAGTNERIRFNEGSELTISRSPCINGSSVRGFEGWVDDLAVFNSVLTDDEIKTLYLK